MPDTKRLVPKRVSLVHETAEVLMQAINDGVWVDKLPSERWLSDKLQISRSTLRMALKDLAKRRVIESRPRGAVILQTSIKKPRIKASRKSQTPVVALLMPYRSSELLHRHLLELNEIQRYLHDAGIELQVTYVRSSRKKGIENYLSNLVKRTGASCWILQFSSRVVQKWFEARGIPCLISGSRQEGVKLPAIDYDYHATAVHCVGRFHGLGHRNIGLLIKRNALGGDIATIKGFESMCEKLKMDYRLIHFDNNPDSVFRALRMHFDRPNRPTGLLVSYPFALFATFSYLSTQRSFRIGRDVSLVARDADLYYDFLVPSIACYQANSSNHCLRMVRIIESIISKNHFSSRQSLIMPTFQMGDSLGPVIG